MVKQFLQIYIASTPSLMQISLKSNLIEQHSAILKDNDTINNIYCCYNNTALASKSIKNIRQSEHIHRLLLMPLVESSCRAVHQRIQDQMGLHPSTPIRLVHHHLSARVLRLRHQLSAARHKVCKRLHLYILANIATVQTAFENVFGLNVRIIMTSAMRIPRGCHFTHA